MSLVSLSRHNPPKTLDDAIQDLVEQIQCFIHDDERPDAIDDAVESLLEYMENSLVLKAALLKWGQDVWSNNLELAIRSVLETGQYNSVNWHWSRPERLSKTAVQEV